MSVGSHGSSATPLSVLLVHPVTLAGRSKSMRYCNVLDPIRSAGASVMEFTTCSEHLKRLRGFAGFSGGIDGLKPDMSAKESRKGKGKGGRRRWRGAVEGLGPLACTVTMN
jgi:hypothetical protein